VPTYQYACKACDHRFEAVQSFSDSALTECPECTGILRKVFSSVGIVFKGSGFYRTDSRSGAVQGESNGNGNGNGNGKESSSSSSSEGSSSSSGEKKSGASAGDKPAAASTSSSSSTPAAAAS
jgi:putative FmdB family regulatory protein